MNLNLQPNIYSIQKDVINSLSETSDLFRKVESIATSEKLSKENRESISNFLTSSISEIEEAKKNVEHLELRMAIVAPMKAGKSTIVNAIIGQEILPNRNAAMTTIPTEIILDSSLYLPELLVSDEIKRIFEKAVLAIQKKIKEIGDVEKAKAIIAQYPHLHKVLEGIEKINSSEDYLFADNKTTEQKYIINKLSILNDAIRLCSLLSVQFNPLQNLSTIPRIKTPFFQQQNLKQKQDLGDLVIIDTPGPNEAGDKSRLLGVVRNELKRSSIVLVVLDYTQLNTEAAENIKKEVEGIIKIRGNQDSLYILVNKVEQRRKGDMSPEDIQNFVVSEFGIDSSRAQNTVFEISARRAFSAASFFKTINDNSLSLEELKKQNAVRLLAEEAFGVDWEEDLESADREFLEQKANRIWEKSKFGNFMDNAINALMESAAPLAMKETLNLSHSLLGKLKDETDLRNQAIFTDASKLQCEINSLKQDLNDLDEIKKKLGNFNNVKEDINKYNNKYLSLIQKNIESRIEELFIDQEYDRGNLIQKLDIKSRKLLLPYIDRRFFPTRYITEKLSYKFKGKVEFEDKNEADKFATESISYCIDLIETALIEFRNDLEDKVKSVYNKLANKLESETKSIIKKATERLKKEFEVKLEPFSSPKFRTEACREIEFKINRKLKTKRSTEIQKRRSWKTLWLLEEDIKVETQRKQDYYEVVLEELVKQVNVSIENNINNIKNQIKEYLDEEIQCQIDIYFYSLNEYLSGYRESLENAQSDKTLTRQQQEQLQERLNFIVKKSTEQMRKCENYLEKIQNILPKSFHNTNSYKTE
ncbi:MAG: hypothetical protein F6K40_00390 [Okeania sp. SIO3I5]|uniref:dynamin family protein n=1 Tax=Okeania sp. SIO3I5 TaxID=2607805 RepID=UPI0013B9E8FB|nr:dynamin family protein [Okeania sp. SIO3I5]NEQ34849.1 hypothetical protein [Okeania sp. SIO3I5]